MNKVLLSSVLVGLLSVSAEAIAVTESDNQIQFTTSGDTFTPSGGVYEVSDGTEKTITLNKGVQTATINSDVSVANGKIVFNLNGTGIEDPSERNEGTSLPQYFYFGAQSVGDVGKIQNSVNGVIDFNFFNTLQTFTECYVFTSMSSALIENSGTMNFYLHPSTHIYFSYGSIGNIEITNSRTMNFILQSGSGLTLFKTTNDGKLLIDLSNTQDVSVSSGDGANRGIINQNQGSTTIRLLNAKYSSIGGKFINNTNDKQGIKFEIGSNSSVMFIDPSFSDVYIYFKDGGNTIFLNNESSIQSTEIQWLDSNGKDNLFSLGGVAIANNQLILKDTWGRTEIEGNLPPVILRSSFNKLEIGTYGDATTGIFGDSLNFLVFVNTQGKGIISLDGKNEISAPVFFGGKNLSGSGEYAYSDRVVIHSSQNNSGGIHNLGIFLSPLDYENIPAISYHNQSSGDVREEGNIAVASVANTSNVKLKALSGNILGFNLIETSFEEVQTNAEGVIDGTNGYTTYFLKSAQDVGVAPITQEVTSSVFALNYDLFIANFNSLNKRMGDLRNNPYSQGAWGRIFNGQLSNDFGLGSTNNYTTFQAGYDYDFTLTNAKNYLGVAFAYGFSISEMSSSASNALQSREIKDIFSNNIELALYNAYVEDSGLYSDSIAKFSYLISNFNLTNNGVSEKLNVNNYALQLSEEVGYVFSLGGNKEWSITPQAELSFGYYSDSDLTQVAGEFYLDAKAKSMLMLRARVGAMVGYDFKQFTQGKDITTTLYAGLSYEYDYLNGGDIELTPNVGKATTTKSALSSDGRGVLNLGTNITFKDDIRLYVDFQTSFGGKINTDYQINIGARFSFGEKGENRATEEMDKTI